VEIDISCPGQEPSVAVQFRAANEPPRDPFADPRLPIDVLIAEPGRLVVAVTVPADAAVGSSVFDLTCLNPEGGGIIGATASFNVTGLAPTGTETRVLVVGAFAIAIGMLLVGVGQQRTMSAPSRNRRHRTS
jgi:hypothetical protein